MDRYVPDAGIRLWTFDSLRAAFFCRVDMAKAFLDDKDAGPDKLTKYYQYVVR